MNERLEKLQDQLGELMVESLRAVGGDELPKKIDTALGVFYRHSDRLAKGELRGSEAVYDEMQDSLDRAKVILTVAKKKKQEKENQINDTKLRATGAMISAALPIIDALFNGDAKSQDRKIGFVLLTFPMNRSEEELNDGMCNFGSNGARREDVKGMFQFLLDRWNQSDETKSQA